MLEGGVGLHHYHQPKTDFLFNARVIWGTMSYKNLDIKKFLDVFFVFVIIIICSRDARTGITEHEPSDHHVDNLSRFLI
jgi:hypothetical protein